MKSREKRIKSGNQLEVEIYPVTEHGHRYDRKRKLSRPEQQALNEKNAIKTFIRLVNTNFVSGDIVITLEYNKDKRPSGYNQLKRDVQNYIRRIKYYRNKHDLPIIKYVYVIELQGVDHWHCHMIMSKIAREVAESLWDNADFVNSKSFQPTQQDGGEAIAKYFMGQKGNKGVKKGCWRRWNSSNNLKQPIEEIKDQTHTRSGLARIARERIDDRIYWERKHKGYRFVSATPTYNEFNGWWYIYVKMYRDKSLDTLQRHRTRHKRVTQLII